MELTGEQIKAAVKTVYARKAEESDQWYPYCFASQSAFGAIEKARTMGYSEAELKSVPQESIMGLGCGNPFSLVDIRPGDVVLDLGSGGGMDGFLAAGKVGPTGTVVGVDITEEMIRKAQIAAAHYGYWNVKFRLGEMESLPFISESMDVVMSNCAISLSIDKGKVFREVLRVLRPGGTLAVCEIARREPLPIHIREDVEAWATCVAGAIETCEVTDALAQAGFEGVEVVWERDFEIDECRDSVRVVSIGVRAQKRLRRGVR